MLHKTVTEAPDRNNKMFNGDLHLITSCCIGEMAHKTSVAWTTKEPCLRLDTGWLRHGLRILRDRPAGVHAQPDAVRDRGAGPPLLARAPRLERGVHGDGRAARQLRRHDPRDPLAHGPARPGGR